MHVPIERQAAFDAAIRGVNADGPVYRIAIEGDGLVITGPGERMIRTHDVDGHLAWAKPCEEASNM